MLKLKLQYFGHLIQRANSLEKTLMLGKTEGRRSTGQQRWDGWMASMHMSLSKLKEIVKDREAWCAAAHGVTKTWTWLSNWTTKVLKHWPVLSFMTTVCLFLRYPAFRSVLLISHLLLITPGLVLSLDFWLLILPQIVQINWTWKLVQMMFRKFQRHG